MMVIQSKTSENGSSQHLPKLLAWEFLFAKAMIKTFREARKYFKSSCLLTEIFNN